MYFIISADIDRIGNIILCSDNVGQITGMYKHELMGQSIECIIPHIYRENHEEYLKEFVETGKFQIFKMTRKMFFSNESGNITPCYINIKADHHPKYGMVFLGVIRPIQTSYDYILMNENGKISSATKNIRDELALGDLEYLTDGYLNTNIDKFCYQFKEINKIFSKKTKETRLRFENIIDQENYHQEILIWEQFRTGAELSFCITKNFKNSIQSQYNINPLQKYFNNVYMAKTDSILLSGPKPLTARSSFLSAHNSKKSVLFHQDNCLNADTSHDKDQKYITYHCVINDHYIRNKHLIRILQLSKVIKENGDMFIKNNRLSRCLMTATNQNEMVQVNQGDYNNRNENNDYEGFTHIKPVIINDRVQSNIDNIDYDDGIGLDDNQLNRYSKKMSIL